VGRLPEWAIISGLSYGHGIIIGLVAGGVAAAFGADFLPWFAATAAIDGTLVAVNVWGGQQG